MQGQLPLIGQLQQQVQAIQEEMGSAQFQWDEERLRLAATQEQLTQDMTTIQAHLQQVWHMHRAACMPVKCHSRLEMINDTKDSWLAPESITECIRKAADVSCSATVCTTTPGK